MKRVMSILLAVATASGAFALDSQPQPITPPANVERMYFIDPAGGDDNADGLSRETAWRTLAKANQTLQAGEGVTLLPGEYTDGRIEPAHSGAKARPIVYRGEPGAVVRATSCRSDSPLSIDGVISLAQDWIVVEDLEIDANRWGLPPGAKMCCAAIEGDHNILRRLDMHDANGTGVWMFGNGSLVPGEDTPNVYEAEALPFHIARPDGNWRRPVVLSRGGDGTYETASEPWDALDPLMRQNTFAAPHIARYLSHPPAGDDTWRQPMPVRVEAPGEVVIGFLAAAPEGANVWLQPEGGERLPVELDTNVSWAPPVRLHLDAGRTMVEIISDAPGATFDQVYVARTDPEVTGREPHLPIAKFHYTTSYNVIEDCEIYYCCNLDRADSNSPENRQSTICPSKCGEGNVFRLNRIHHTGADAIQPRRGCDGLLIEWNELYGNSEDGIDLKSPTDCIVRYNLIHSNRGGGLVSHDGHHPDPPMYAAGHEIYGNIIVEVKRFGLLINDAMVVHGDERDTVSIHDNLVVPDEGPALSINWAWGPVRADRNLLISPSSVVEFGMRHQRMTPEGARQRRFNADVALRENVIHATNEAPLVTARLLHPDGDLSWLRRSILSPRADDQVALRVIRGRSLDMTVPEDWLTFPAPDGDLVRHPEDVALREHPGGEFMVFESNEPGCWLEMPFTLEEPATGEVLVALHKHGNRGICRALLDGQPAGGPWDCNLPRPNTGWLLGSLGTHELDAGEHRLRIEVVGPHEGVPTAWVALAGAVIRPEGEEPLERPTEREWAVAEWPQFVEAHASAEGSRVERVQFRDPQRLDYRLTDEKLAEHFGPRWDEHLDWLTEGHLQRINDPTSSFFADHFHWDRSQGPPE